MGTVIKVASLLFGVALLGSSGAGVNPPLKPKKPGQEYGYGIMAPRWGRNIMHNHGGETAGYQSFIGHDRPNKVTLIAWPNLTVSLDEVPTANALILKVLDRVYVTSPLGKATP